MSLLGHVLLVLLTILVMTFLIPAYLEPSFPVPEIFGSVSPGFEEVKEIFKKNYEDGWEDREAGSAFSVYHEGRKVVDLWAGYADVEAKRPWREDTLSNIFSVTKALGVVCIAMLIDSRRLDVKRPVAHYWPEFDQNGKQNISVEQLLEHEAGLYVASQELSYALLEDHESLDRVLAETPPAWEPGTRHGYHGMTMGPYLDALVRRVDHQNRTIGKFFEQEISIPFGIDAYLGVPREISYRASRCTVKWATWSHRIRAFLNSDRSWRRVIGSVFGGNEEYKRMVANCGNLCFMARRCDPLIGEINFTSSNGMATARALARLFGILANGGRSENKTLLSKKLIDQFAGDGRSFTPDLVWFDSMSRWKYGMDVLPQSDGAGNLFGAAGWGGQIGYADSNNKIGYGFISRYMAPAAPPFQDQRIKNLQQSVLRAIKRLNKGN